MKFLVDAQLPPALAAWLVEAGHEAVALREVGLRDASDQEICSFALAKGYIIVTKDETMQRWSERDQAFGFFGSVSAM